ncbi:uncharacterized protein LOC108909950 [Anoplophora glabripennis]|uniref:uncharacterized protein LOC108909950 n=1 Tax=Anoplophora glabripennis TaxID=217634 RepID=UPI000874E193|nr:uncharacterized protein LOC108909950 [Anoplophora glabripennis]
MGFDSHSPVVNGVYVYLFLIFTSNTVHNQEVTTVPAIPENDTVTVPLCKSSQSPSNCTNLNSDALSDEYPSWESPEAPIDGAAASNFPQGSKNVNRPLAVHLIQKFSTWTRPFYEKFSRIKDLLGHPDHPNYGGVPNPQQIWEKLHEKGHNFLTGINGAVYGLAPVENHDYPFAYRGLTTHKGRSGKSQSYDLE